MHQDANGGVDSGHLAIQGYNEVIILHCLPESHKELVMSKFGGLYSDPHPDKDNDLQQDAMVWPNKDDVASWKCMNYCPSVFILKPGQHVHLNKGRIHAFRKVSPHKLPSDDCHFSLREALLEEDTFQQASQKLCISIAWDWMFMGADANSINREVACIMESSAHCRKKQKSTLAIPGFTLLWMMRQLSLRFKLNMLGPLEMATCRGILPSLQFLIRDREKVAEDEDSADIVPGLQQHLRARETDPISNDMICKICYTEIANVYYNCKGCVALLDKDLYICPLCFQQKAMNDVLELPGLKEVQNEEFLSTACHTGEPKKGSKCKCKKRNKDGLCKTTPLCVQCSSCQLCACTCYENYEKHYRLARYNEVHRDLEWLEDSDGENKVEYSEATRLRL